MKIDSLIKTTLLSLPLAVMVGCGGGGGGSSSNPLSTITGVFVDSAVSGVDYNCSSGATGVTNAAGEFTCNSGDRVSFSLGGIDLGTVDASEHITPSSFFPNNPTAALNLAQLLQSLDSDGNVSNGIDLNATVVADFVGRFHPVSDINFTSATFDSDVNGSLPTGHQWRSEADAQQHLDDTFTNLGINHFGGSDITPPTFTSESNVLIESYVKDIIQVQTDDAAATLTLSGTDAVDFTLDSDGNLKLRLESNERTKPLYDITITAEDTNGNESTQNLIITVLEDTALPTVTASDTISVKENDANLTLSTLEADERVQFIFKQSGVSGDYAYFNLGVYSGILSLKEPADYEKKSRYTLVVLITDQNNNRVEKSITVDVEDVAESFVVLGDLNITIPEDTAGGTEVGTISIIDAGDTPIQAIELFDAQNTKSDKFAVSVGGSVSLLSGVSLSYESQAKYNYVARAINGAGVSADANVTITLTDVNNAPTLSNQQLSVLQDTNLSFSFQDFNASFNDRDGDRLEQIIITSLPTYGSLKLSDTNLTSDTLSASQINLLTYVPNVGYIGYDSWNYKALSNTLESNVAQVNIEVEASLQITNLQNVYIPYDINDTRINIKSVDSGDFNNDGKMDFVSGSSDQSVKIHLNQGEHSFTELTVATGIYEPQFIKVADFNGDGKDDILVLTTYQHEALLYLNNGDNTFSESMIYTEASFYGASASIVDIDADGDLDIVLEMGDNFGALLNDSTGVFSVQNIDDSSDPSASYTPDVADIDGDGYIDIVATTGGGSTTSGLVWFSGSADGNFTKHIITDVGLFHPKIDDFDGDGDLDILVSNTQGKIDLYENDGTQSFSSKTLVDANARTYEIGDYDGDGDTDIVYFTEINSVLSKRVVLNNAMTLTEMSFDEENTLKNGYGLILRDFDEDGDQDIITTSGTMNIILNTKGLYINERETTTATLEVNRNTAVTFKNLASGEDSALFDINSATGELTFKIETDYEYPVDKDKNNIYMLNIEVDDGVEQSVKEVVVAVDDVHRFAQAEEVTATSADFSDQTFYTKDVDGDGNLDFLRANDTNLTLEIKNADGAIDAEYFVGTTSAKLTKKYSKKLTDIDNDGDIDVIVMDYGNSTLYWYENDGIFSFSTHVIASESVDFKSLYSIETGDIDGDGDEEIFVAHNAKSATMFVNNGDGSFTSSKLRDDLIYYTYFKVDDIDGDGDNDLLVSTSWYSNAGFLVWMRNEGSLNFQDITLINIAAREIDVLDQDGDGYKDVISLGSFSKKYVNLNTNIEE